MKSLFVFGLLGAALLAAVAAVSINRGADMSAMNCERFDAKTFDETMAAEMTEPMVASAAGTDGTRAARFELKGFEGAGERTTLSIKSTAAGGLVYMGPFRSSFAVSVPERLFRGKGRDNFRVMLSDPEQRRICVAEQGGSFWRSSESVTIELLAERELDRNGFPVAFKVSSAP